MRSFRCSLVETRGILLGQAPNLPLFWAQSSADRSGYSKSIRISRTAYLAGKRPATKPVGFEKTKSVVILKHQFENHKHVSVFSWVMSAGGRTAAFHREIPRIFFLQTRDRLF